MPPNVIRGPVRARDLRSNITEWGFERGVVITIERMLDEYAQDRQHLRQMSEMLDQCITLCSQMADVGNSLSIKMDQMKREREQSEGGS